MLNSVLQKKAYEGVLGSRSRAGSGSRSGSRDANIKLEHRQQISRALHEVK